MTVLYNNAVLFESHSVTPENAQVMFRGTNMAIEQLMAKHQSLLEVEAELTRRKLEHDDALEELRQYAKQQEEKAARVARELDAFQAEFKKAQMAFDHEMTELRCKLAQPELSDHVTCFLAYPFDDKYDPFLEAVRAALQSPPYYWQVITARDLTHDPTVSGNVMDHIKNAHCYLAEISDQNANVMMEVGMLRMLPERPSALLRVRKGKPVPSDLQGWIYIEYPLVDSATDVSKLASHLRNEIQKNAQLSGLKGGKRFLSAILLANSGLAQNVIEAITDAYMTVEAFLSADAKSVADELDLDEPLVKTAQSFLQRLK